MPLLDPLIFNSLFDKIHVIKNKSKKQFFRRYLKIASLNLYKSPQTIEASFQFKKDLEANFQLLNQLYKCKFTRENLFNNPMIDNYYQYLYDHINKKISKKQTGEYNIIHYNYKMYFFQPYIEFSGYRSWYFTNSPFATLVISEKKEFDKIIIDLSNLEIDLMAASGFIIVLCVRFKIEEDFYKYILTETIANHPFAEIHFSINYDENVNIEKLNDFYSTLLNIYDKIDGYFYLYSPYVLEKAIKAKESIKKLKQKPRFRYIFTSTNSYDWSKSLTSTETQPFSYCLTGFDDDQLRIHLCNVPLYQTEEENDNYFTTEFSGNSIGYISKSDFLNYTDKRVKIIFNDITNNNRHSERYIDFDDMHCIRSDMYAYETIYLAKVNENTLDSVIEIGIDVKNKVATNEEFQKELVFSFFKEKKMLKGLAYVSYAYVKQAAKYISDFRIHKNQILTAFEACKTCLFTEKRTNNGVIYQVETGEGKSCIIQIIAAVLALMKKTVHITSSNINLSNRDYYNSYEFFDQLGLTSAVLLHYNELPYININNSINNDTIYKKSKFPRKFFSSKLFKNSSNMNFSVCGINIDNEITKDKANIVFSTFVNFESLYLRMMEIYPTYIYKYFKECSLIVDEADSILIDELTNGTILSRPIKTNANEILNYVYNCKLDNVPAITTYNNIHEKWPECFDLKIDDVNLMYQEIDLVNQDEFVNGKKYSIEEFELKEEKSLIENLKKSWEDIQLTKAKCQNQVFQFMTKKFRKKKDKEIENINKQIFNNKININQPEKVSNKSKVVKVIIPFDYDHKGILEPNKEFSGFVQQFIAIKEMHNNNENKNMLIKELSMNFLFVSHPIFVNLYDGVVGLTGTIGNKYDKKIFREHYNLTTMKIPRNNPNKRIELPILLCDDVNDRNNKIVSEIFNFHEKEFPVLVIFQDLNEISSVLFMLIRKGIKNINVFDGKDEKIKPDIIAGLKGAVSLGTNFCGRGTDIKKPIKPLHVILTYFSSNARVMHQAFGRTARQGEEGTVRIICLKEQFILPNEILNRNEMDNVLDDFKFKNDLQIDFIEKYKKKREWIFYGNTEPQKLTDNHIEQLRETKINVNRIKAFNFQFPICISIPTYLNIQAQKVFSLYNCPNCKFTWILFQKYAREMILESWSLFISNSEMKYKKKTRKITYKQYLQKKVVKLYNYLDEYFPEKSYGIIDTFLHIHNMVVIKYQSKIMGIFPDNLLRMFKQNGKRRFCSFIIGFKPFSLVDKSGAKINIIDGSNQDQHYISDPELKYMKKEPKGQFSLLSITEKIDGIFNWICQKINDFIGSYIGLKFFLRRTLGGCEFGVCLDFDIEIPDEMREHDCLIDHDPLLMFTISVKSMAPILAGILIIGLVYLVSISGSITEWIASFPQKITRRIIKKTLIEVASVVLDSQIELICDKICSFLLKILDNQVTKMNNYDSKIADIFQILMKISAPKDFAQSGDAIQKLFEKKVKLKVKSNFGKFVYKNHLPWAYFVKIGFLLMLCFASFMINFHLHRQSLKFNESKAAEDYDKKQDANKALETNINIIKKDEIGAISDKMDNLELKT